MCLQDLSDFGGRKLIRLNRVRQMNHAHRSIRPQAGGNGGGGTPAGLVAVQHQGHVRGRLQQRTPLRVVKRGAHQSYRCHARLVQFEAVKETFQAVRDNAGRADFSVRLRYRCRDGVRVAIQTKKSYLSLDMRPTPFVCGSAPRFQFAA